MGIFQQIIATLIALVMTLFAQVGIVKNNIIPSTQLAQVSQLTAPVLIQSSSCYTTGLSCTISITNTAGNFLWIGINDYSTVANGFTFSVSDTKGNSYSVASPATDTGNSNAPQTIKTFYAANIASGANTITCNRGHASSSARCTVLEYSGIAASSPLDTYNQSSNSNVISYTSGTVSTSNANDLLIGFLVSRNSPITWSNLSGTSRFIDNTDFGVLVTDQFVSSTGNYSASATASIKSYGVGSINAFKSADTSDSGGGGGSTNTAPTISSFIFSPSTITQGQSSTLSWSISGNPAPSLSVDNGVGPVGNSVSVSPSQTTTYTLTATNPIGSATFQTTLTVNPVSLDTAAPSVPTNLTATAVSSSQINLSWTASTDNTAVTGYKIYRNDSQIDTSPTNSYSDTSLTASTQYLYNVSAYDTARNNSSQSISANATTQAPSGGGRTFYIDYSNGSDINSGTSKAAPWQHAPGMKGCSGTCLSHLVSQTDQFIFKGGVVWTNAAMPWLWTFGSASTPNSTGYPGVYLGYDPTWNAGQVLSVRLTSSGSGCTSAPSVGFSGGGGSAAAATATIEPASGYLAGLAAHVTVTNAGSGYTSNPTVSFSGGGCISLPTGVADIYSPIFDLSGTLWDSSVSHGPMYFSYVRYLTIDHWEVRNMTVDATSGGATMLSVGGAWLGSMYNTVQNMYFHNWKVDTVSGTATTNVSAFIFVNGTSPASLLNSTFDNSEANYTAGTCGYSNGVPQNHLPPCGQGLGAAGATTAQGNIFHDIRGELYAPGLDGLVYSGNTIWSNVIDCCGQHEDAFYFFGAGLIYNNVIHDLWLGAAAFYIETCRGNPCTQGNTTHIFNNVVWNVGQSTQPIGYSSEFWGTADVSPSPALYAYNNTLYSLGGTRACIAAGQWYGSSATRTLNFYLYNNHCISDQTSTHWFYSATGSYGTWNGLSGPNGTATKTAIDAVNVIQSPAVSSGQGYTIANQFAPTSKGNATVGVGTNLTTSCAGISPALCSDFNGNARPASGVWQAGAYQYGSGGTLPPSDTIPPLAPTGVSVN